MPIHYELIHLCLDTKQSYHSLPAYGQSNYTQVYCIFNYENIYSFTMNGYKTRTSEEVVASGAHFTKYAHLNVHQYSILI